MATKLEDVVALYAKAIQLNKEHFTFTQIPQHALLCYPSILEYGYDLDLWQIIDVMTEYVYTEIPEPVGILPRKVTSTEITDFIDNEYFVKYWVKPDNTIIRLTEDFYWQIIQMPNDELTIIIEEIPHLKSAATFTNHYLLEIVE